MKHLSHQPATSVASTTGDGEPKGESLESVYQDAISEERLLDLSPQMTTPPSCHHDNGLVLIDLTQLSMFVVSGYLGDSSHDYFSAQVIKILSLSLPPSLPSSLPPSLPLPLSPLCI